MAAPVSASPAYGPLAGLLLVSVTALAGGASADPAPLDTHNRERCPIVRPERCPGIIGTAQDDGRLFIGTTSGLFAVPAGGGRPLWHALAGQHVFGPRIAGETVWAGTRGGRLLALDVTTGNIRLRHRFPGWVYAPALAGGLAVTGGSDRTLWAVDQEKGALRWQKRLSQELTSAPVRLSESAVAAATYDGALHAVAVQDGSLLWSVSLPGPATGLEPAGGALRVRTFGGTVVLVDPETGATTQP
ncbi:outer membrane protein assembly factor BamB family protein [Arhodomonas sp. SL1]|uniref:outer membrane protein assembly factor BamB family protein n=1 Tax=Arhodomonas sp. SL1 TaxID=3425691 RepID=UPI003F884485